MSKLIDFDTYVKLRAAAPKVTDTPEAEAKMVLQAVIDESIKENVLVGLDGALYYQNYLAQIKVRLPDAISSNRVGAICRSMGFVLTRATDGYRVAWNLEQVKILHQHLKMS